MQSKLTISHSFDTRIQYPIYGNYFLSHDIQCILYLVILYDIILFIYFLSHDIRCILYLVILYDVILFIYFLSHDIRCILYLVILYDVILFIYFLSHDIRYILYLVILYDVILFIYFLSHDIRCILYLVILYDVILFITSYSRALCYKPLTRCAATERGGARGGAKSETLRAKVALMRLKQKALGQSSIPMVRVLCTLIY